MATEELDKKLNEQFEKELNRTPEEEAAYQCAYDLSDDWLKEAPDWNDVQKAFLMGVKYGKK